MKELRPELVATYAGDVRVFEGHAFVVEAAVSVGACVGVHGSVGVGGLFGGGGGGGL